MSPISAPRIGAGRQTGMDRNRSNAPVARSALRVTPL